MKPLYLVISKLNLLGPAIFLTRSLNVGKKIILIGTLLLLPLLTLTYLFIEQTQQQISSVEQKRVGVAYSVKLRTLFEALALYRGLVFSAAQGEAGLVARIDQQLQAVNQAVRSLDEIDRHIQKALDVSKSWANLKGELTILNDEPATDPPGRRFEKNLMIAGRRFDEHSKLINDVRLLMIRVGDNSTLILDANMDSFYLMSLMVNQLPTLANATQTLRGLSSTMAEPTNKVRGGANYLPTLLALVDEYQRHVAMDMHKVIQRNPHLHDQLNTLREAMSFHLNVYTQTLEQQDSKLSSLERFESGTAAVQSIFSLYDEVAIALDISFEKQARKLTVARNWATGIIAISLLLTFYLWISVYLSIVKKTQTLVKATKKIAEGEHEFRINIPDRDEFGLVADGLNCMADRLEEKHHLEVQLRQAQKHKAVARMADAVFEASMEALMVINTDYKIKTVNRAFCQITGYNREDILGENSSILLCSSHREQFYNDIAETLHSQGFWAGEFEGCRNNGETYIGWLTITAMRNEDGIVDGYISLFSDISERKANQARIQQQANFDSLTGLANRNLFSQRFSHSIELAERAHKKIALLFVDLDGFKYINDALGHSVGDQLLQEVAVRLKNNLRKSDTVSRFGGDEFAIVLTENCDLHAVENVVIKLLDCLAIPYQLEGNESFISASIGISVYPDDGEDTETLLRKADQAMYRAKESGRNGFQFFTTAMDTEAHQRREIEKDLRHAMENQEFTLNYQPIIEMDRAVIVSAEALIRWNHPQKGIISPSTFIPIAEEMGLILKIGEWVLREACREAVKWSNLIKSPPSVAVNLSSYQFQRQDIPKLVNTILAETGLPAARLKLEITESLLVADDASTLDKLKEIRSSGVELSIDDFGTGYSSLSYLKKFPVNYLKIDRSFIAGLPVNSEDIALVNAILAMAQSLNLKVISEGVETQAQAEFLKAGNCQFVQGYFYSRPLSKEAFIAYLKNLVAPE